MVCDDKTREVMLSKGCDKTVSVDVTHDIHMGKIMSFNTRGHVLFFGCSPRELACPARQATQSWKVIQCVGTFLT